MKIFSFQLPHMRCFNAIFKERKIFNVFELIQLSIRKWRQINISKQKVIVYVPLVKLLRAHKQGISALSPVIKIENKSIEVYSPDLL